MTSMNTNMEGHLDEQPPAKKQRIDDSIGEQQQGSEHPPANGVNADEQKEELETSTTTTTVDLPCPRYLKLPAELNSQIFLCLNPASQRKFIYGLGWDFYAMFRYKLLKKTKRLCNPNGNRWEGNKGWGGREKVSFSHGGLNANSNKYTNEWSNVWAAKGFAISGPNCREDDFPGTVLYYFEVKILSPMNFSLPVGLTDLAISDDGFIGEFANSYATSTNHYEYRLANGDYQDFEFPQGAIRPQKKGYLLDVYGCGLLMDPDNKLAIFFTLNGQLLGRQIPICPSVDRLFPAVTIWRESVEANFGDDKDKPFLYDIKNCPGLDLPCF